MFKNVIKFFVGFLSIVCQPGYGLVSSDLPDLDHLSTRANLIFKGDVVKVETRFAQDFSGTESQSPYTFVTYRVEQTLKGQMQGDTFTLRFAGGPINSEEFTLVDGLPLMDVGDKDVLFVRGNGEDPCPLVNCAVGRFREIEGFVLNDLGQAIEITEDNQIKLGRALNLHSIQTNTLSEDIELTRYESELEDEYISLEDFRETEAEQGFRPAPAGLIALITDAVDRIYPDGDFSQLIEEKNLDPNVAFVDNFFSVKEAPSAEAPPHTAHTEPSYDEPWQEPKPDHKPPKIVLASAAIASPSDFSEKASFGKPVFKEKDQSQKTASSAIQLYFWICVIALFALGIPVFYQYKKPIGQ